MILLKPFKKVVSAMVAINLIAFHGSLFAAKQQKGPAWYEIEVIIFLNLLEVGVASETWQKKAPVEQAPTIAHKLPISLELPGSESSYDDESLDNSSMQNIEPGSQQPIFDSSAGASSNDTQAYVLLERDQFQLGKILNRLNKSANYKPILHIAWRQPTLHPTKSQPVYVFDGMDLPYRAMQAQRAPTNPFSPGMNTAIDISEGPALQFLSGTIRVSVSRYLHIETELHIRSPVWQQDIIEVPAQNGDQDSNSSISAFFGVKPETTTMAVERQVLTDFNLLETRRMRSTEIHYYDHPKFGVIVMATPYDTNPEI